MRSNLRGSPTGRTLDRWNEGTAGGGSDDAAVLAGLLRKFALLAQPKANTDEAEHDDTEVEGVTQRYQNGLEGPFDELANGGDEVLEVHGSGLLPRK